MPHGGHLGSRHFRCCPLDGGAVLASKEQRDDFQAFELDIVAGIQRLCEPAFPPCLVEETEVIVDTHPGEVREVEPTVERQRGGGPIQDDFPVIAPVLRARGACDREVRVRQRAVQFECPTRLFVGLLPPYQ